MAGSAVEGKSVLVAALGKATVALAVFAAVVGGWVYHIYYTTMHEPLPGGGGRQGSCVIWFVGSSSIANWTTLDHDMRPWTVHNRGAGGAKLSEIVRRFGNDGPGPAPEAIVFYAGENDIASGIPVAQAVDDFRSFMTVKSQRMPHTPVFFMSLKPSPKRWSMRGLQAQYNAQVQRLAAERPDLDYIDIVPDMLVNGRPGPFFDNSGIHMLPIGHRKWAYRVRAALVATLPGTAHRCLPAVQTVPTRSAPASLR